MSNYLIENTLSSHSFGEYDGDTADAALDAMARDAGYRDYAHLEQEVPSQLGEIICTKIA